MGKTFTSVWTGQLELAFSFENHTWFLRQRKPLSGSKLGGGLVLTALTAVCNISLVA